MNNSTNSQVTLLLSTTYEEAGEGLRRSDWSRHAIEVITESAVPIVIEASVSGDHWFAVGNPTTGAAFRALDGFFPYLRARRTDTGEGTAPTVDVQIASGFWLAH